MRLWELVLSLQPTEGWEKRFEKTTLQEAGNGRPLRLMGLAAHLPPQQTWSSLVRDTNISLPS